MRRLPRVRWVPLTLLLLLLWVTLGSLSALTASNTVPVSGAGDTTYAIDPNDLKPPECSGITLQTIVNIAAGDTPTNNNDLILGTSGSDLIFGLGGDDCILGGGGDDGLIIFFFAIPFLYGNGGNDVILGGPGDDVASGGAGTDTCYGGPGNDILACENAFP
ncbi:MAG: hypothetical protein D6770_07400 [Anaerolineae bacterium]|nr:MAG: hypothetical protein D6770_07400 [Anaerolineae bacterium]